jgi:molecular chaperone DnaK (HSP70)
MYIVANFMIVDCGGGTVDVTTRKLTNEGQLGEITERAGDFCGSSYVDAEFIKYLRQILGNEPIDLLENNSFGQKQYLVQQFCKYCKFHFTGEDRGYCYTLDIEDTIPILKEYVTNKYVRESLEENDWTIDIDFATVKSIFEPVIQRILKLIKAQLRNSKETCSAMFLVGGFSESKYLQKRIKQEFQNIVELISVPVLPTAAISRGATMYGLSISSNLNHIGDNKSVISSRILKYTYGCDMWRKWVSCN